jgi:hypothetical protein
VHPSGLVIQLNGLDVDANQINDYPGNSQKKAFTSLINRQYRQKE